MADGKKSPEYTRLALSFLGGVALTLLIMSLTAGSLLQGYMSFGTFADKDVKMVQTSKDIAGKRITGVTDTRDAKVTVERKWAKVKDMRQSTYRDALQYKIADGGTFSLQDVATYTFDDGSSATATDVQFLAVSGDSTNTATLNAVSYTLVDGTSKDVTDVVEYKLTDGTMIDAGKVYTLELKDAYATGTVYTLDMQEDVATLAY